MAEKFYGGFAFKRTPVGLLSGAACAILGRAARKSPTWKAYAAKRRPATIARPGTLADCNAERDILMAGHAKNRAAIQKRMDEARIQEERREKANAGDAEARAAFIAARRGCPSPIDVANALPATAENHARPHHAFTERVDHALVSVHPCTMLRGTPCNRCRAEAKATA